MSKVYLGENEIGVNFDTDIDDTKTTTENTWSASKVNDALTNLHLYKHNFSLEINYDDSDNYFYFMIYSNQPSYDLNFSSVSECFKFIQDKYGNGPLGFDVDYDEIDSFINFSFYQEAIVGITTTGATGYIDSDSSIDSFKVMDSVSTIF